MGSGLARFKGFPLLRKDLLEQAARRRTYSVRVLFALCLLIIFLIYFRQLLRQFDVDTASILGSGRNLFQYLAASMIIGLYLLVPALVAGIFPAERERGTMELLWITELRPTEILLESYLGRLVTIVMLLLVAVPLLTLSYTLGGITETLILVTVYFLFLTTFQLSALALFFSAAARTPLRAILGTYVTILALNAILPFFLARLLYDKWLPLLLSPMGLYFNFGLHSVSRSGDIPLELWINSVPALLSGILFLVMARFVLVREFSPRARSRLRFPGASEHQARVSRRFRQDTLIKGLPDTKPVAWRESRPLVTRRLFRAGLWLALAAEFVVFGLALHGVLTSHARYPGDSDLLHTCSVILFINWTMAVLATALRGASAFPAERSHQTLEVLLTSPLSSAELVRQKWKGIRRTLILPVLTLLPFVLLRTILLAMHALGYARGRYFDEVTWVPYLTIGVLSILIYLPLTAFFSLWVGLRSRTTTRAALSALFLIFAGIFAPLFLLSVFEPRDPTLMVLSPISILFMGESGFVPDENTLAWLIFANFALYGTWLALFRFLCLKQADMFLKRVAAPGDDADRGGSGIQQVPNTVQSGVPSGDQVYLKIGDEIAPGSGRDPAPDPD